jgi:hypothetical protein
MSRINGILCGVPDQFCTGGKLNTDQNLQHNKIHHSHEEAFRCMARYLTKELGYIRLGSRDFYKEGEPVLILTKKIRFGGLMRLGKEKRLMPGQKRNGNRGLIVG